MLPQWLPRQSAIGLLTLPWWKVKCLFLNCLVYFSLQWLAFYHLMLGVVARGTGYPNEKSKKKLFCLARPLFSPSPMTKRKYQSGHTRLRLCRAGTDSRVIYSRHETLTKACNHLFVPRVRTSYGKNSFSYQGTQIWNCLGHENIVSHLRNLVREGGLLSLYHCINGF